MGVEATSTATGRGRDSVRISSKAKFNDVSQLGCLAVLTELSRLSPICQKGIYILDLQHMPVGCGTVSTQETRPPEVADDSLLSGPHTGQRLSVRRNRAIGRTVCSARLIQLFSDGRNITGRREAKSTFWKAPTRYLSSTRQHGQRLRISKPRRSTPCHRTRILRKFITSRTPAIFCPKLINVVQLSAHESEMRDLVVQYDRYYLDKYM
jgi:hypothetical protein